MENKKTHKKLKIVLLILAAYLVVIAAVAFFVDARHVEIKLLGQKEITLEYGSAYDDPGVEACLNGRIFGLGEYPGSINVSGQVDSSALGDYTLDYTAAFLGKEVSVSRLVHVVDTTAPVIELQHKEGYKASWFTGYEEEGFIATDNVDGDISHKVERTETDEKVVYTVTDSSGNSFTVERMIVYGVTSPTISLSGSPDMQISASLSFTEPGYRAMDSLGNDLTEYVTVTGQVVPYHAGDYELCYSIENERGDSASVKRRVTVLPVERPDIVQPTSNTIYLTFDDGPGPYTSWLLDILANYNVKATFFVTGEASDYNHLIGRAYREGHSIGVHTYSHNYYDIYSSEEAFFNDFNAMQDVIYQQTGSYTRLCRFPGGSSNTVSGFNPGIMSRLSRALDDLGYRYFDWNVSSGDAGETTVSEEVSANVIAGCAGRRASVVLQHDIKDYSVSAVEDIILWGLYNGYSFEALDMTSPDAHHGINN
ncbi:MAG: DUF5011 domain-containing protein [Oscillospiraceae bacterium]|nr:DUF5011 domain-containing protein [Oscillospiraceae bacterium]